MCNGAEDEGIELRSVEGARDWREEGDEELERRDQVEASHLVLSLSHHHLPSLFRSSLLPHSQARPLRALISPFFGSKD